jgi:pyruvate kinase
MAGVIETRRTSILATLGPASSSPQAIAALLQAGADAFRLNFSHGTIEQHRDVCGHIREAAERCPRAIGVLQDLAGPKIRIGRLNAAIDLLRGDALAIELGDFVGGPGRVSSPVEPLFRAASAGARLLLDDGRIELEVTGRTGGRLDTRVLTGGRLESNKGINVPGAALALDALTEKDRADLRAGIAMGVDMAAVSFVQSANDLHLAREVAREAGAPDLPLIAKIEKPQALDDLDAILEACDGLMVARGDLGVEIPLETLPAVQRTIIRAARRRAVPVIVATQVLESMREAPRPTRAEVTDAAHAVDQGADAIMLAGETAAGRYPTLSVETLDRIIREAERYPAPPVDGLAPLPGWSAHGRALCQAAVTLAERARADAIVAVTGGGRTARMLSALRPTARILAVTPSATTAARLALTWGVTPVVVPAPAELPAIRAVLRDRGHVPHGRLVVFVAVSETLERETSNFMHIESF